MNEDFVPFELAVKLQEKGFPQEDLVRYDWQGKLYLGENNYGCAAPTIPQVLKWLRKEKKIHLMIDIWKVDINDTAYKWGYDVVNLTTTHVDGCDTQCANSFEEAALAGIEYVLDNLI